MTGEAERIAAEQVDWWIAAGVEIVDALDMLGVPGEIRTWSRVAQHVAAEWEVIDARARGRAARADKAA